MALVAPIPMARTRIEVSVNAGERRSLRKVCRNTRPSSHAGCWDATAHVQSQTRFSTETDSTDTNGSRERIAWATYDCARFRDLTVRFWIEPPTLTPLPGSNLQVREVPSRAWANPQCDSTFS